MQNLVETLLFELRTHVHTHTHTRFQTNCSTWTGSLKCSVNMTYLRITRSSGPVVQARVFVDVGQLIEVSGWGVVQFQANYNYDDKSIGNIII